MKFDGKIIAFVHAKSSSERVKDKNMRVLGDRPLFCHALTNAIRSALIEQVVVDSDSDEILSLGKKYGALPLRRPAELATNAATGDDLMFWQASNCKNAEVVLQVIPTSPFIKPDSIDSAIRMLLDGGFDSVAGVRSEAFYEWKEGRPAYLRADGTIPNSFELDKTIYETTGLYVNKFVFVLSSKKRVNPENCGFYELSKIESVDINTEEDFEFAQIIWTGIRKIGSKGSADTSY